MSFGYFFPMYVAFHGFVYPPSLHATLVSGPSFRTASDLDQSAAPNTAKIVRTGLKPAEEVSATGPAAKVLVPDPDLTPDGTTSSLPSSSQQGSPAGCVKRM